MYKNKERKTAKEKSKKRKKDILKKFVEQFVTERSSVNLILQGGNSQNFLCEFLIIFVTFSCFYKAIIH
jgi:hypothetical protein